jgi:hypothetical protein
MDLDATVNVNVNHSSTSSWRQREEVLVYRNGWILGRLPSEDHVSQQGGKAGSLPVLVTLGTGFTFSVGLELWQSREFLEAPQKARSCSPEETQQALSFFKARTRPSTLSIANELSGSP